MAAREPKELWLIPGMAHAEAACDQDLVDRIARWVDQATLPAQATPQLADPPGTEAAPVEVPREAVTPDAAA